MGEIYQKEAIEMKKRRLLKFTAVIIALLLLVSCAPQGAGSVSSAMTENENQSPLSSTTSEPESSDKENTTSKQPQKEQTASKPDFERPISSDKETSTLSSALESYVPYVMPENNPPPISIHGANAAIPAKFSYTDFAGGEEMTFGLKKLVVSSPRWDLSGMAVIKTYNELKTIQDLEKLSEHHDVNKGDYYTDHYDETFFENKALIMILLNGQAHEYEISKILKNDDQICVYYKITRVNQSAYATQYRTFIEVSQKDLNNASKLVIYVEKYSR